MNNITRKLTAAGLCAAVCLGCVGVAFAKNADKEPDTQPKKTEASLSDAQQTVTKDETVYVLAGADGSVQKIIVSDWIKNAIGSDTVTDKSDLTGIENVKGDESYTMDGQNMTVWDAQGNDIYYQGNIEKELPVNMTVTYKLDGKVVSAQEIAGKSGKVTIRFDYQNNQYETVQIDGKQEKIYVPFAMLTGMMLDSDTFRNVRVSNGKLLNDGDHTVVVGIAFPGLQENLGISREDFEIPNYVEITADVTDFAFNMTVTIATNEIFNRLDADRMDISDVDGSLGQLTDAVQQLTDGSSQLYDGLCTLLEKSDVLVAGVKDLAEGAKALKTGAADLDTGAGKLLIGAAQLNEGLGELSGNSAQLNNGAKEVFESLLATATTQIRAAGITVTNLTIDNYGAVLSGVIKSLEETAVYDQALAQVTTAVEAKRPQIKELVTAQVVPAATGMSLETYQAAVAAGMVSDAQQSQINAAIEENVGKQVAKAIEENMKSETVQSQLAAAAQGRKTIEDLQTSLDSYNKFYQGVLTYTAGVDQAAAGAGSLEEGATDLKNGTEALKSGADKLYSGVLTLQDGMPALVDGVSALRDGAMALSDGMKQLQQDGVQKLSDLVQQDLGGFVTRLRATIDVSKSYTNFSGIADDAEGQVKFIYRTEQIGD